LKDRIKIKIKIIIVIIIIKIIIIIIICATNIIIFIIIEGINIKNSIICVINIKKKKYFFKMVLKKYLCLKQCGFKFIFFLSFYSF